MSRLSAPFIGVALVAGAFWVATQSYQKNFSDPALSPEAQQNLGIQLLEFPRNVPPLERLTAGKWQAINLQPKVCDAVCQGQMAQQASFGVHIVPPSQAAYQDLVQVTSADNYAIHQGKVLLINPEGKFAGSIKPPYDKSHLGNILNALNP